MDLSFVQLFLLALRVLASKVIATATIDLDSKIRTTRIKSQLLAYFLFNRQRKNPVCRDVVLTKQAWERTQKSSHFKTASNSF